MSINQRMRTPQLALSKQSDWEHARILWNHMMATMHSAHMVTKGEASRYHYEQGHVNTFENCGYPSCLWLATKLKKIADELC